MREAVCRRALSWRNTILHVSICLFVLNAPTQVIYCFAIHFWYYCGLLLHKFHHQHSISLPENSCHQPSGRERLFRHFHLVWWMGASIASTALWFHHSQKQFMFHHLLLGRCFWDVHWHLCGITVKNSKPKPFSASCAHLWAFPEPILRKTCDNLAKLWCSPRKQCVKFVEVHRKFLKAWSAVFHNFFGQQAEQYLTHYRWQTTLPFIGNICSPSQLWTFYTILLQLLHSLQFYLKPLIIHDGFPQHSCVLRAESGQQH
jgi:hypothetical protein